MQTFLPYADFNKSAKVLDDKRLWKQVLEAKQILNVLNKKKLDMPTGWRNHPAVLMWEGYEAALKVYQFYMLREWIWRRFQQRICVSYECPSWLNGPIHSTHRSNLLRKNPEWYSQFGWAECPDLPYFWPAS